jgi:hypothetical protein
MNDDIVGAWPSLASSHSNFLYADHFSPNPTFVSVSAYLVPQVSGASCQTAHAFCALAE